MCGFRWCGRQLCLRNMPISGVNATPRPTAVYASDPALPRRPQDSLPSCLLGFERTRLSLASSFQLPLAPRTGLLPEVERGGSDVTRPNSKQPCCTRDEGRPLGPGLQDRGPNHRKLPRHNGRGGERCGKGGETRPKSSSPIRVACGSLCPPASWSPAMFPIGRSAFGSSRPRAECFSLMAGSRYGPGRSAFTFMAEVYWDLEWTLQQQGFDYCYDKRLYDRLQSSDRASPDNSAPISPIDWRRSSLYRPAAQLSGDDKGAPTDRAHTIGRGGPQLCT